MIYCIFLYPNYQKSQVQFGKDGTWTPPKDQDVVTHLVDHMPHVQRLLTAEALV